MGMGVLHLPIPDGSVPLDPEADDYEALIEDVAERLKEGQIVVVHCRGGQGRSGLVAASVLVVLGHPAVKALESCAEPARARCRLPSRKIASTSSRWSLEPRAARARRISLRGAPQREHMLTTLKGSQHKPPSDKHPCKHSDHPDQVLGHGVTLLPE